MRVLICVLAGIAATGVRAAETSPLEELDRRIAKQPTYNAKPLYAIAAIGAEAKARVWLVLDRTKADARRYDLLYADLNGNGDLSEPGERFTTPNQPDANPASVVEFKLPDVKDSATGHMHTRFTVRVSEDPKRPYHIISLRWRDKDQLGGGYPTAPAKTYMQFTATPRDAPILWFNGDAPVRFFHWSEGPLKIGEQADFQVFVGYSGRGNSAACAFQEHILPEAEGLRATLRYTDAAGKDREVTSQLMERC